MKRQVAAIAVVFASTLAFAGGAPAQEKKSAARQMEAVVTVTKVDPATRTVHVRARRGQPYAVHLPEDVKIAGIKEGSRYRVRYSEPVATSIEPGAQAAAAGATREAQPGAKAGEGVVTAKLAGVIETLEPARKEITVRTLEGDRQTLKLGEGVSAESLKTGEAVTVTYQRAVASRMVSTPQEMTDPAAYNP